MKIYTKTGDGGTTALFGGTRVPKHHVRIDAYGTVDELNSWLGPYQGPTDRCPCQGNPHPYTGQALYRGRCSGHRTKKSDAKKREGTLGHSPDLQRGLHAAGT